MGRASPLLSHGCGLFFYTVFWSIEWTVSSAWSALSSKYSLGAWSLLPYHGTNGMYSLFRNIYYYNDVTNLPPTLSSWFLQTIKKRKKNVLSFTLHLRRFVTLIISPSCIGSFITPPTTLDYVAIHRLLPHQEACFLYHQEIFQSQD